MKRTKRSPIMFKQKIWRIICRAEYQTVLGCFDRLSKSVSILALLDMCVCEVKRYLALATHSMIASFLPMVTLVFLGGMIIAGAMGSAGPPTSKTPGRRELKQRKSQMRPRQPRGTPEHDSAPQRQSV